MKSIMGKKIGMTQIFDENGVMIPVTVVEAGPVVVTQIKTEETDGYNAVQVGFGEVKEKHVNKQPCRLPSVRKKQNIPARPKPDTLQKQV